ncbi:MAG: hypothetical protein KDD61_04145 [Bdellovibrionales bacterium]|nr:hypothetical protein [Bdellovibrionales bacterium]
MEPIPIDENSIQGGEPRLHETGVTIKVANRFLLSSIFADLYLPDNSDLGNCNALSNNTDKSTCNLIRSKILLQAQLYKGNCSHSDSAELGCNASNAEVGAISSINLAREAGRINFCERLLSFDRSLTVSLERVPANINKFEQEKVSALIQLYYPEYQSNPDIESKLLSLADSFEKDSDKWRFISLALCKSPGWQVN